uniref:CCHC-type domain-containing protein n=3 Tax=Heliothis virescens TaxID=7102 RepID=A0A2A4K372_HELVI
MHSMTIDQRKKIVNDLNLCFNCLRPGHESDNCKSKSSCFICNGKHNTLLHVEHQSDTKVSETTQAGSSASLTCASKTADPNASTKILGTALVRLRHSDGSMHYARALIDSGSMDSFITNECARRLGLRVKKCNLSVSGIGQNSVCNIKGHTVGSIIPRSSESPQFDVSLVVLPKITSMMPSSSLPMRVKDHFAHLDLADCDFHKSGPIDLLLGVECFDQIYTGSRYTPGPGLPCALSSVFGWVITGRFLHNTSTHTPGQSVTSLIASSSALDDIVQRSWESEEPPKCKISGPEDEVCEQKFKSGTYRTLEDHEQAMAIMTSLSMFAFKTCLKFMPVLAAPDETEHVMTFINPEGVKRCRIHTEGHSNYHPHLIDLGYECLQSPEIDMIIMRALGMPFEHTRINRDEYIDVLVENIEPKDIQVPLPRHIQSFIDKIAKVDKHIHKTTTVWNCDYVSGERLVLSPTGKISPYHDARVVREAAYKGMVRALDAGAKKPLLVVQNVVNFPDGQLVCILGALEALYIPLQSRERDNTKNFSWIGLHSEEKLSEQFEKTVRNALALEKSRILARDIAGGDPERMTPVNIVNYVKSSFSGDSNILIKVIDDSNTILEEYPLLAAVSRAASQIDRHKPRVVEIEYKPSDPTRTCLKFMPVLAAPDETEHVMTFINPEGVKRCRIHTEGHSNYHPHLIDLGYECLQSPEIDMIIMRALGMPFEHTRINRDEYIDVLVENIEPNYVELYTKDRMLPPGLWALPYDVNSVMHFGERDYSKNGHRTIIFKNNVKQNRNGLSSIDLRKIEAIYGPECRARDRMEKYELCQSFPGVARRKREVEPPANKSLRVNPEITPPPTLIATLKVQPVALAEATPLEDVTPEPDGSEYINANLDSLGIANETDMIIEQVYKVSALALKHAREKYCNKTSNITIDDNIKTMDHKKRSNASDILGILEVIADYAKSMVDTAVANLTSFCENSESIETYQRQCKFGYDSRCPKSYKSTKSGAVRYSTNHRPVIKQQTRHEGSVNKYSYDKMFRREGDETTPSLVPRRKKREVANTEVTKPEEEKAEAKKEVVEVEKEKLANDIKEGSSTKDDKKPETRFFKRRRYEKKYRKDGTGPDWDGSDVSLVQNERMGRIDTNEDKDDEESMKEIEAEAEKSINKEELVKEVINEGLDSILNVGKAKIKGDKDDGTGAKGDSEQSGSDVSIDADADKDLKKPEAVEKTIKKHRKKIVKKVPEATKNEPEKPPKDNAVEKRSHSGVPRTVRLNKLNREFYAERKWPDGIVRYVIKKLPEFDLEDLRNRLAEVNSILTQKTCVKLHEVDAKEARGYDDYLILDTTPDYVTGKVGGKQVYFSD